MGEAGTRTLNAWTSLYHEHKRGASRLLFGDSEALRREGRVVVQSCVGNFRTARVHGTCSVSGGREADGRKMLGSFLVGVLCQIVHLHIDRAGAIMPHADPRLTFESIAFGFSASMLLTKPNGQILWVTRVLCIYNDC